MVGLHAVLCTRPTIRILDQYIRKQYSVHLSGIQTVWLSGIQMNAGPFGIQPLFDHLNTKYHVWHSDPHCTRQFRSANQMTLTFENWSCIQMPFENQTL